MSADLAELIGRGMWERACAEPWASLTDRVRADWIWHGQHAIAALRAAGYAVVPREPTDGMGVDGGAVLLEACEGPSAQLRPWKPFDVHQTALAAYRAMLAAAEPPHE